MTLRSSTFAAAVALVVCSAASARAQSFAGGDSASQLALAAPPTAGEAAVVSPVVAPMGPAMSVASVGFRTGNQAQLSSAHAAPDRFVAASGKDNSLALMVVGGGAFLAGALIGNDAGTVLMVGGAVVGLYGLYQYLDHPAERAIAERAAERLP